MVHCAWRAMAIECHRHTSTIASDSPNSSNSPAAPITAAEAVAVALPERVAEHRVFPDHRGHVRATSRTSPDPLTSCGMNTSIQCALSTIAPPPSVCLSSRSVKNSPVCLLFLAGCLIVASISLGHFIRYEVGVGMSHPAPADVPEKPFRPVCRVAIGGNKMSCEFSGIAGM